MIKFFLPCRARKRAHRLGDPCRMPYRVNKEVWLEHRRVRAPCRARKGARRVGDPCRMPCKVRNEVWLEPRRVRIRKNENYPPLI